MAPRRPSPPAGRRIFRSRILPSILALILAALLFVDAVWWFRAQRQLDRGVRQVLALTSNGGWRASARTGGRGGWPWSAEIVLRDPVLQDARGLRWTGEGVAVAVSPLRRSVVTLRSLGTQSLLVPLRDEPPLPLRVWGSRMEASWPRSQPGRLAFSADALHLALNGFGPDDAVQAAALEGSLRAVPGGGRLAMLLRDLALPALLGRAGGRVLPAIRLSILFPDLMSDAATPPSPGRWRSHGGRMVIEEAAAEWDDASATLAGEATLGPDGRLSGSFSLLIRDPDAVLDRMRDAGLIGPGEETSARAVLDVIRAGENGAGADPDGPVRLALALDRGLLCLGRIPLARLPAVAVDP